MPITAAPPSNPLSAAVAKNTCDNWLMLTQTTAGAFFLKTELNAGLTFAWIALSNLKYQNADKVKRNRANAVIAYKSLLYFRERVLLTPTQSADFDIGFARLQERLRELGEEL
jgi:hypothetical protein